MKQETSHTIVTGDNSAATMGSGDLAVFATPSMVALMENAAMRVAAALCDDASTSVGTHISVDHTRASGLHANVTATATLVSQQGRELKFEVVASDERGEIGRGTHTRFIVDRERFMSKL